MSLRCCSLRLFAASGVRKRGRERAACCRNGRRPPCRSSPPSAAASGGCRGAESSAEAGHGALAAVCRVLGAGDVHRVCEGVRRTCWLQRRGGVFRSRCVALSLHSHVPVTASNTCLMRPLSQPHFRRFAAAFCGNIAAFCFWLRASLLQFRDGCSPPCLCTCMLLCS